MRRLRPVPTIAARLAAAGATVILLVGCAAASGPTAAGSQGGTTQPIDVVATTTVFADLVHQVGGDLVTVTSLVPKGGEVHTFEPRPSDLTALERAKVVFMNGVGLDDWMTRMLQQTATSAPVVRLGDNLPGVKYIVGDEGPNPHLWMNVAYARMYVGRIADALSAAAPASASSFAANAKAYDARLATLDGWVRDRIATIPQPQRRLVSFHDAFPYYAEAYGLTIVGVVVPAPGQDPSAGEIAQLVQAIREAHVKAVFSEVQFSPQLAQAVAKEAGAIVVSDLYDDTVGDPPVDTYEGIIRWDTDKVVAALAPA
jgi:ABC-type Zn uptake system ZnuABC Zn-binding protein ZnuA